MSGMSVLKKQKEESTALLEQNRLLHFNSAQGAHGEPSVSSVCQTPPLRSNPRNLLGGGG